jgi:hypothetical protein
MADPAGLQVLAGKVYYYQVRPVMRPVDEHEQDEYRLDLTPLEDDEGKFGVKVCALSTSTPKHCLW